MTPAYVACLDLPIWQTNVRSWKMDGLTMVTYRIVIAWFLIQNKFERARFFEETFLVADINMKAILRMPFLSLNNMGIRLVETSDLILRNYTAIETLLITKKRELMSKKECAKANLDENTKFIIVYVVVLSPFSIHPSQEI